MKPLLKLTGVTMDEQHRYHHPKRGRLPSVSKIMVAAGITDLSFIPASALERGTNVHRTLELLDTGKMSWDDVPESMVPYVVGWVKFKREQEFEAKVIETPVGHPLYGYAGTPDRIGVLKRKWWSVVEIKSGIDRPLVIQPEQFDLVGKVDYSLEETQKGKSFRVTFRNIPGPSDFYRGTLTFKTNFPEKPELTIWIFGRFKK